MDRFKRHVFEEKMTASKKVEFIKEFLSGRSLIDLTFKYNIGWFEAQDVIRWGFSTEGRECLRRNQMGVTRQFKVK